MFSPGSKGFEWARLKAMQCLTLRWLCGPEQSLGQWRKFLSAEEMTRGTVTPSSFFSHLNMQHVVEYHGARAKQWVPLWDQLSASKWASRHQPTCSKENTSSSSQWSPSAQYELGRRDLPPWFACVYQVWACQPILPTTAHVSFKTTVKRLKNQYL